MADGLPVPAYRGFGLLGILNLTPDSFFDGGKYVSPEQAEERAGRLLGQRADVLDLGAESTRPGARAITPEEEMDRLLPALAAIRHAYPNAALSVDTRNSATARAALESGCQIINDVSACRKDPALLEILAEYKPAYVLMHSQGDPETMQTGPHYDDVVAEVMRFFECRLSEFVKAGLPENRIALDPGIGFGKTRAHNLELLRNINLFSQFGRPLMAGISMKGTLASFCRKDPGEATAIASVLLYEKGVFWHRVHEPDRIGRALVLTQSLT